MINAADHPLVAAHAAGVSYRDLGQRIGCSHEHVRQTVLRQGTALLNALELDLMVADKYLAMGRPDKAEWPGLIVPFEGGGWSIGVSLVQFVVDGLKRRGIEVNVVNRPTPSGAVFFLMSEGAAS